MLNKLNRRVRLCWLLILTALLHGPTAQAQAEPVPLEDYWRLVDSTAGIVAGLDADASTATLKAEADALEAITAIRLPDDTVIPIDSSYLVALMREDPPNLAKIEAHLRALLARKPTRPEASVSRSATSIASILARPEFQWQEIAPSNPITDWVNLQLNRVLDFLLRLLPAGAANRGFGPVITTAGIILLALVLGFALRGLIVDFAESAERSEDDDSGIELLTAASALQRAQDNAAAGDYRTAVRYLYLSTLLQLEEHHLLRYDRARTNREYLRSVAHSPRLVTLLQDVVEVFDRVWYGYQSIDEATFQQYVARITELGSLR